MHHETQPVCVPYQNYIYQPSCHKHQAMDIVISALMMQDVPAMKSFILILTAIAIAIIIVAINLSLSRAVVIVISLSLPGHV